MDKIKLEKRQATVANPGKGQSAAGTDKRNFAFGKINFILIIAGVVVVLIGLFLMAGGQSTEKVFDPSIFSAIHIKVAPVVTLIGFISIIFAILIKPKDKE